MHRTHRTVTQYVIPRYIPMCLVLAGIIAIHFVDNFPISTIDMLLSAFSIISPRKRLANSPYTSDDGHEKLSIIIAPTSKECMTRPGDTSLRQERVEHGDNEETSNADLLGNPQITDYVALSLPSKPFLKPIMLPMTVLNNSGSLSLASPSSPTPEFSLEHHLKEMDIEDECWSPSPSFNDTKKVELITSSNKVLKANELKDSANVIDNHSAPPPMTTNKNSIAAITKVYDVDENTPMEKSHGGKESIIPRFYYAKGEPNARRLASERNRERMIEVNQLFRMKGHFTEENFLIIAKACGLPRYMTLALFRKIECFGGDGERVFQDQFMRCWSKVAEGYIDDHEIMFNILCKNDRTYISPEDMLPVLEDVVCNHPGLEFLADNVLFQERYIETVICRIYYENRCSSGRLSLSQLRKYNMGELLSRLEQRIDLNSHFYVLYCKFWLLDQDHDLIVSQNDMLQYNNQMLTSRITARVMKYGKIMAFPRDTQVLSDKDDSTLTYMDFIWFLISEIDKTTRMSAEYWFRCMDLDSDGIISSYELSYFWEEQEKRQMIYGVSDSEMICFEDVICQLNDLIKPKVLGQFTLTDLRNSKLAERFFDTFINFHRLQIHESSHNSTRLKRQYLDALSGVERFETDEQYQYRPICGQSVDRMNDWCAYAEIEYQHLVAAERNETIWDDVGTELDSCQQLDMDGDKMMSTVERLFNGGVDFSYVDNLENATQEDLEAMLQRVAKTTFSSKKEYSVKEELEDIHNFSPSDDGGEDKAPEATIKRARKFQI
ncbi:hypothetical protein BGW37DRAFT_558280 [Umbelopsis sp. PMI_123]|nr:hypothetical protein BGW37DRAFT_558280 [Umbelopsis sp. PMI_123]